LRKKAAAKKIKKYMFFKTALFYTEIRKANKNGESFYFRYRLQKRLPSRVAVVSNRINHRVSTIKLT
jgi:hypothetical protein